MLAKMIAPRGFLLFNYCHYPMKGNKIYHFISHQHFDFGIFIGKIIITCIYSFFNMISSSGTKTN